MATKPSQLEGTSSIVIEPWNVILLNDDFHAFEEVTFQLMRATSCTQEVAEAITWEAHSKGEAVCFTGSRERCELVASILEEIELRVRLEKA
jgi:ATP-dependent Clp protease adaptor protein ClpS